MIHELSSPFGRQGPLLPGFLKIFCNFFPVNRIPDVGEVFGTAVLVFQVVSMDTFEVSKPDLCDTG